MSWWLIFVIICAVLVGFVLGEWWTAYRIQRAQRQVEHKLISIIEHEIALVQSDAEVERYLANIVAGRERSTADYQA